MPWPTVSASNPTFPLLDYWKWGVDQSILSGLPNVEECQRVAADVLLSLLRQKMAAEG